MTDTRPAELTPTAYEGEWKPLELAMFWDFQRVTRIDAFELQGKPVGYVTGIRVGCIDCLHRVPERYELPIHDLDGKWARFRLPVIEPGTRLQLFLFEAGGGEIRPIGVQLP